MHEKDLSVNIKLHGDAVHITVSDHESGDCARYTFPFDKDGEAEMTEKISSEIWSWAEMLAEERDDKGGVK